MSTVFVLVTDEWYWPRAQRTIMDLRSIGKWTESIVIIAIGSFSIPAVWKDFYSLTEVHFPEIEEKNDLVNMLKTPFPDSIDHREIEKRNQWEKLHVFDEMFMKWDRVVYLDAGLRVLENVHKSILPLQYKGLFLAPDDGGNFIFPNLNKQFSTQISYSNLDVWKKTAEDFGGVHIFSDSYFLNCMWVYDTNILKTCSKQEMIAGILSYPICKTNEMTLMNLFLHFKYKLWKPFPVFSDEKYLFDWSEWNNPNPATWQQYCFIKYPRSLSLNEP